MCPAKIKRTTSYSDPLTILIVNGICNILNPCNDEVLLALGHTKSELNRAVSLLHILKVEFPSFAKIPVFISAEKVC